MKRILVFFILTKTIFSAYISIAQIPTVPPQAFNYQAILRNNMGIPMPNQTISLKFSIIDSNNTMGQIVYVEKFDTITNQFGLINVEIGKGTVITGSFANILWGFFDHYLKTEIDTTGSGSYTFMGISQLISVPYALYAQYAGPWQFTNVIAPALPPSTIFFIGNQFTSVGIGTSTPDPSAVLDLSSHDQGFLVPRLTSTEMNNISSPANGLLIFNVDSNRFCYSINDLWPWSHWETIGNKSDLQLWNISGNNIYYSIGNVGIGSNNPRASLQVSSGDVYIENIGSGVIMKSPNGNCWRMTVDNSGNPVYTQIPCP